MRAFLIYPAVLLCLVVITGIRAQESVFNKYIHDGENVIVVVTYVSTNVFKQTSAHLKNMEQEAKRHGREFILPNLPGAAIRIQGTVMRNTITNLFFCWTNGLGISPTQEPPIGEQFKILDANSDQDEYLFIVFDKVYVFATYYKRGYNAQISKREVIKYCHDGIKDWPVKGRLHNNDGKLSVEIEMLRGTKETYIRADGTWKRVINP